MGAHFIQAAWWRHRKRKLAMELLGKESLYYTNLVEIVEEDDVDGDASDDGGGAGESSSGPSVDFQNLGATILASKFAANTRKGKIKTVIINLPNSDSLKMPKMFKPTNTVIHNKI
ncbi:hypothetical protein LR48_Vigan02g019000 [Vigna angularis]|nr:hypothetical protein LR48_Vigan02g019000 [Vigna angularis]